VPSVRPARGAIGARVRNLPRPGPAPGAAVRAAAVVSSLPPMPRKRNTSETDALEEMVLPPPIAWTPSRVFVVGGTGVHEKERIAVQHAMRAAGVEQVNLVKVSSVVAPECELITAEEGRRLLRPGNVCFAVIAQAETDEPHQRIAPGLAWAKPEKPGLPGFIAEVEEDMAKGKSAAATEKEVGEEVLDLMAMRLRAKVDAERLWAKRGRARRVRIGNVWVRVGAHVEEAVGPEPVDGKPRTAAAFVAAIYL
jgi:arginine decarboxylase